VLFPRFNGPIRKNLTVDKIDPLEGMFAEDHVPGGDVGTFLISRGNINTGG
jgi:hypothetical protein